MGGRRTHRRPVNFFEELQALLGFTAADRSAVLDAVIEYMSCHSRAGASAIPA